MWLPCLHLAGVARVTSADMMGGESLSGRVLGHIDIVQIRAIIISRPGDGGAVDAVSYGWRILSLGHPVTATFALAATLSP